MMGVARSRFDRTGAVTVQRRLAGGLVLLLLSTGCRIAPETGPGAPGKFTPDPQAGLQGWISVNHQSHGFISSSGKRFVPWGFNYDRDHKMRLLEDYWDTEWQTVTEDFREMKALGANVVRIHLQFARFMDGAGRPNSRALQRLGRLLRLAENTGLYLDLTGLACYRKQDVPSWYARLSEAERWNAQSLFWEAVARQCARSPAVFCYDLMNEPVVPTGKRPPGDWLAGELAGFSCVQFISLAPGNRPRPEIARQWIAQLTRAIRKHDRRHLVTVGLLPNSLEPPVSGSGFPPAKIASELDFISVHLYPKTGRLEQDLELLQGFQVGKPVVIEELFPLDCQPAELEEFIGRSRVQASGWIGFYWGQTPADLQQSTDVSAAVTLAWLELFQRCRQE
jgi:hypothetical protein